MSNLSRPDDTRCPIGDDGYLECDTDFAADSSTPPGLCRYCGVGTCSLCNAPMSPEQCAESRRRAPVASRNEVYCPATCLEEDTDGVPEVVAEEATVPLPRERIGADGLGEVLAERGREMATGRKAAAL